MIDSIPEQDREALASLGVSHETLLRLSVIVETLRLWQPRINLIAPSTVSAVWRRHVVDSAQLLRLAPQSNRWLDLGSGGGFPGLVVAAQLAGRPASQVILIESNGKKCAFLREAVRRAELPVQVVQDRIDRALRAPRDVDTISARALAPLTDLLGMIEGLLKTGSIALFPKGAEVEAELTEARKSWKFTAERHISLVDPRSCVLKVSSAERLARSVE